MMMAGSLIACNVVARYQYKNLSYPVEYPNAGLKGYACNLQWRHAQFIMSVAGFTRQSGYGAGIWER